MSCVDDVSFGDVYTTNVTIPWTCILMLREFLDVDIDDDYVDVVIFILTILDIPITSVITSSAKNLVQTMNIFRQTIDKTFNIAAVRAL